MDQHLEQLWPLRSEFKTPIQITNDNEYLLTLEQKYQRLIEELTKIGVHDFYIAETQKYARHLTEAIKQYCSGYLSEAQTILDTLLLDFPEGDDVAISDINNSISFCNHGANIEVEFFRARCNNKIVDYKKSEMLHIPFSKRSIVKTERFSVPGLPCLYLGTTSYVCWLELGRPADHEFNVSPVQLDNTQRVFNLAVNFSDILGKDITDTQRETLFRLFLLAIATSFKVKETGRNFKSEYIISQLLMLSCMKRGISGLTYYSKQVDDDFFATSIGVNLALFATDGNGMDLSDICNHLKISDSFNYAMYKQLTAPQTFRGYSLRVDNIGLIQNIGTFERQYPYRETKFYQFDRYLYAYYCPTQYTVDNP